MMASSLLLICLHGAADPNPDPHATSAPPSALTQAPADGATQDQNTSDITAHVFASVGVSHNFVQRSVRQVNAARVFDTHNDSFRVDVAELVLQKDALSAGDAGFRLDLTYGSAVPSTVAGFDFDVQQAFVTYVAPVGSGLTLDAGTFVTHVGAELIDGYDGYNDNYTRSILFGYAVPFAHTGVRASYALSPSLSAMASLTNGWNHNALDNNRSKSLGLQLAYAPTERAQVVLGYLGGPEQAQNNTRLRHLVDVVAVVSPHPRLSLTANADYGWEQTPGEPTVWWGVAGVVSFAFTESVSVAARAEYYDDREGGFSGLNTRIVEGTVTPSWKLTESFMVRGDVRVDRSLDSDLFGPTSKPRRTQTTIAANAVFAY